MKTLKKAVFATLLLLIFKGNAQQILSGKVVNYKNKPVVGVKIFVDSTDTNVETDKVGMYSITLPQKVKSIKVYSKKYGWLSNDYTLESKMDFIYLDADKTKKEKNTAIGQSISPEKDRNTVVYRSIYDMIRGRIAGVIVQPDNTIIIRGISSIKNNAEPLFVVDGNVVSSIDYIVPNEVKSISVLKDAEASIYGSRGSSGVLVITTKK